ncbi:MAG: bacterial Ig-like domain-containing protein [Treponema sp.]|nr:bacterial Ig-like domain-containing protein [Treponema sp.]
MKNYVKILFALACILMAFIVFGCNPEVTVTPISNEGTTVSTTSSEEATTTQRTLESITVTTAPTAIFCFAGSGENLSTDGMVVTATYNDGSSSEVAGFTTSAFDSTSGGIKALTVSYTEDGVTKTATTPYYVAASDALTQEVVDNRTTTISGKTFQLVKFGDFPQTIADDEITYSESTVYNGWYLGSDGYFYERCTANHT